MAAQTESDREFLDGVSPYCVIDNQKRIEAVSDAVAHYGRDRGAEYAAILWGCIRARNALKAGHSGHRAIQIGKAAVDEFGHMIRNSLHLTPVTGSWNAAKAMGVVDIHCNSTGVQGHREHDGKWYRVKVEATHENL